MADHSAADLSPKGTFVNLLRVDASIQGPNSASSGLADLVLASLAASLVIALAAIEPDADVALLWDAANLEEDWQAELWGKDAEAMERREKRAAAFAAAARFAGIARS